MFSCEFLFFQWYEYIKSCDKSIIFEVSVANVTIMIDLFDITALLDKVRDSALFIVTLWGHSQNHFSQNHPLVIFFAVICCSVNRS